MWEQHCETFSQLKQLTTILSVEHLENVTGFTATTENYVKSCTSLVFTIKAKLMLNILREDSQPQTIQPYTDLLPCPLNL